MITEEIMVEGFKVLIEKGQEGGVVLSVPELPGCVGQVEKREDAVPEMRKLIAAHLRELAEKKPKIRSRSAEPAPAPKKKDLN